MSLIDDALDRQLDTYNVFRGPGGPGLTAILLNRHEWYEMNATRGSMRTHADSLAELVGTAATYVVTREMSQVVTSGLHFLEDERETPELTYEMLPTPSGFVWLETPYRLSTYQGGVKPVYGFFWLPSMVSSFVGDTIDSPQRAGYGIMSGVILRARDAFDLDEEPTPSELALPGFLPYDIIAWGFGVPWRVVPNEEYDATNPVPGLVTDAGAEWRRWLIAFWSIANQRIQMRRASRGVRRRFLRTIPAPAPNFGDVRVITLRRAADGGESFGDSGEYAREYSHRWIVNGHWRWQACGPGRKERKLIWIAPFEKGPSDKPLVVRDDVRVLRR